MGTFICHCHWCGKELVRKTQGVHVEFHYCNNTCKAQYQRTKKPVTKEWLYEHYITKGLDTTQIGHMVGRDPKSVWTWLKDFGIPTRKRGHASNGTAFPKGHKLGVGRKHSAETRKKLSDHAKATGRVPYDPAVGSYMKGRKGANTPGWKGGITPERQKFYQTTEWKKAERFVKKRDGHVCQRCGKAWSKGEPFDIHHIVSFACVELRANVDNLVYLCERCHYWVHSSENKEGRFVKPCP